MVFHATPHAAAAAAGAAKPQEMASGKEKGISSFFQKVATAPPVATLSNSREGESPSLLQSCDADCCSDEKALCTDSQRQKARE